MKKLGCHLYPWNSLLEEKSLLSNEMEAVLKWISEQGFNGIETGLRFIPKGEEQKVRKLLKTYNLDLAGVHTGAPIFDKKQELEINHLLVEMQRLANFKPEYLVVSGKNKSDIHLEDVSFAAKMLSKIGEACNSMGIQLVYHNHDYEFIENAKVEKILIEETHADMVSFALDIGWMHNAGISVQKFYLECSDRVRYLHLRDAVDNKFIELGKGEIDFKSIINMTETSGYSSWYTIEMELGESYCGNLNTPEETVASSLEYIKTCFKVV